MDNGAFGKPVYVKDGFITFQIGGIPQALAFLGKWPTNKRGVVYDCVCWGMIAALHSLLSVGTARNAFVGWARAHGILAQNQADNTKDTDARKCILAA